MITYICWGSFIVGVVLFIVGFSLDVIKYPKLVGIVPIIGGVLVVFGIAYKVNEFSHYKTYELYSNSGSNNFIEGSFVLGSGTVETKEVYLANIKDKDGDIKRLYIPVKDTIRRFIKGNKAYYKIPMCKFKGLFNGVRECREYSNILEIPENSIQKVYKFE